MMETLTRNGRRVHGKGDHTKRQGYLTVDTSGSGLHKRGYRVKTVAAPIKETLAAAMVQLSFWNKDRVLLDPCCGSGTISNRGCN